MKSYKTILPLLVMFLTFMVSSCGTSEKPAASDDTETTAPAEEVEESAEADPLSNKGVGPITSVVLAEEIDEAMAAHGKEVYDAKCTACHRVDMKFVGPSPQGIFERRAPEWIMNMILNPEKMIAEDPDAKALLIEFNGAPMANQNLTEEEARAVLEYFRTI